MNNEQMPLEQTITDVREQAYEKGLNEAWEFSKFFAMIRTEEEWTEFYEFFDLPKYRPFAMYEKYSPSEAIAKMKAFKEEQANKIVVGDEVINVRGIHYVVTGIRGDAELYCCINASGDVAPVYYTRNDLKKTGRHFSEIAAVLRQLKQAVEDSEYTCCTCD